MKKSIIILLAILVILVGGYYSWSIFFTMSSDYIVVKEIDSLETITAAGKVIGDGTISLAFKFSGTVEEILVEEGYRVEQGHVLAYLENQQEQNLLKQRENNLEKARTQLYKLQNTDYVEARENLNQAQAQLGYARSVYERTKEEIEVYPKENFRQAEIQANAARELYERKKILYEEGYISSLDLQGAKDSKELAESSLAVASSQYEGRKLELERVENDVKLASSNTALAQNALNSLTGEGIKLAKLQVEQAEIILDEAEINYQQTIIKAPETGVITDVNVNVGEQIQSAQSIFTLVPEADTTFVEVQIDEDLTGRVVPGQKAWVTSTAFPDKIYSALVSWVSPGIDADRGTFGVRLRLEDFYPELAADLTVFAEIIMGEQKQSIILEQRYIYQIDDKNYVFISQRGQAYLQAVQVKDLGNGKILVEEGLSPGDIVLTSLGLTEGQRIRLAPEEE